jgi:hypothetical protein
MEIAMPRSKSNIVEYHNQREREERLLAAATDRPDTREMHLELVRLHAMLGRKWERELTPDKDS